MTQPQTSMSGQGGTGRQTTQQQQTTGGGQRATGTTGSSPLARLPLVMRMRTTAQRLARSLSSEVRSNQSTQQTGAEEEERDELRSLTADGSLASPPLLVADLPAVRPVDHRRSGDERHDLQVRHTGKET